MPSKEQKGTETHESFVPPEDRPAVGIKPDTPITELRVRDLASILHLGSRKDFWDGKSWQKDDFDNVRWFDEVKRRFKEKPEKEIYEGPDLTRYRGDPDPFSQIMHVIAGLTQQVNHLASEVGQLKNERNG